MQGLASSRLVIYGDPFSSYTFQHAPLLLLLKPPFFRPPAYPRFLSYRDLPQRILHQFHKPFHRQFPVGRLAAGLLGTDAQDPVPADPVGEAARDEFLLIRGKAGRIGDIEQQRDARIELCDAIDYLTGGAHLGISTFTVNHLL